MIVSADVDADRQLERVAPVGGVDCEASADLS
jgi:hypothetical protein